MRGHVLLLLLFAPTAAGAQVTTDCSRDYFGNVRCTTNQQSGINWNLMKPVDVGGSVSRGFEQGRRIAQERQQHEAQQRAYAAQERAAEALRAQTAAAQAEGEARQAVQKAHEDSVNNAMQAAINRDNAPVPPPPKETPVVLSCAIDEFTSTLAIYEKSGRVDVTEGGVTKARAATFTPEGVSWSGPVWRTAVNRVDLSLITVGILPEMSGTPLNGTCALAQRKF